MIDIDMKKNISNLDIKKNTFTTILGPNNCGKTKLTEILKKKFENAITIFSIPKNINVDIKELIDKCSDKKLNTLLKKLKIKQLLDYSFKKLSIGEKQLIQIASILLSDYDVIILDNALSNLSSVNKELILKYLKQLNDKTIINITTNKEDIVYGDNIVLINNDIVVNDKTENVIKDESVFKSIGFELPFMALLSLKLKYYDLLDKPIMDMNRMVNKLWK